MPPPPLRFPGFAYLLGIMSTSRRDIVDIAVLLPLLIGVSWLCRTTCDLPKVPVPPELQVPDATVRQKFVGASFNLSPAKGRRCSKVPPSQMCVVVWSWEVHQPPLQHPLPPMGSLPSAGGSTHPLRRRPRTRMTKPSDKPDGNYPPPPPKDQQVGFPPMCNTMPHSAPLSTVDGTFRMSR